MNLHIGDPCVFCAVPHDQVPSGECPRNMIKEPRLEELYSDPRGAMILKGEIRLLIPAYRLLRDQFAVKPASTTNPVEQLLENIRKPNNGFLSPEDANMPMQMILGDYYEDEEQPEIDYDDYDPAIEEQWYQEETNGE